MLEIILRKRLAIFITIKKTSKGIYGQATPEEASELEEEGIDVATIPCVNKSDN